MQKSCTYKGRNHIDFKVGDHVFLKIKTNKSSLKLGNCSKLEARYCELFEILERIGPVEYMLELPTSMCIQNVFHVSLLKKYIPDANHVIDWNAIQVKQKSAFQVYLVCIFDQKIKQLRNRTIDLVKVQWTRYGHEDVNWEHEDAMQAEYLHIFKDF